MIKKDLYFVQPTIGMDVEFFFQKEGKVVGSEKVIDIDRGVQTASGHGKIICDGVQGEINPKPSFCRALLSGYVSSCICELKRITKSKSVDVTFSNTLNEIEEKEFTSLSDKSKQFGCSPDFDAHNDCSKNIVTVDPSKDRNRSCGGHIHIGFNENTVVTFGCGLKSSCSACNSFFSERCTLNKYESHTFSLRDFLKDGVKLKDIKPTGDQIEDEAWNKIVSIFKAKKITQAEVDRKNTVFNLDKTDEVLNRPDLLIPMMDILVGIPSVLLDRDKNAAKRRNVYGKAGCFRYQPHGIEYRTLSNFWLRSYPLMGLILGQARLAFLCVRTDFINGDNYFQDMFKSKVNMEEVISAINNNDFELAKKIFLSIENEIMSLAQNRDNYPLFPGKGISIFKQLVIDGYENYFRDLFYEWNFLNKERIGWENFAETTKIKYKNIEKEFLEHHV